MFRCVIHTDGAAYRNEDGDYDPSGYELRKNLKKIIEEIKLGYGNGYIVDTNGNNVGTWDIDE